MHVVEFVSEYFREKGISSTGNINIKEKELGQYIIELIEETNYAGVDRHVETVLEVHEDSESDSSVTISYPRSKYEFDATFRVSRVQ